MEKSTVVSAGANRLKVSLNEVSPLFIAAVLAREDARFYTHQGIDWRGILRALVRDVMSGSAKEGASSITQQLARNSLPLGGRTISRNYWKPWSLCASSASSQSSRFSSST
jgi:penicillin-binding protein 1A